MKEVFKDGMVYTLEIQRQGNLKTRHFVQEKVSRFGILVKRRCKDAMKKRMLDLKQGNGMRGLKWEKVGNARLALVLLS